MRAGWNRSKIPLATTSCEHLVGSTDYLERDPRRCRKAYRVVTTAHRPPVGGRKGPPGTGRLAQDHLVQRKVTNAEADVPENSETAPLDSSEKRIGYATEAGTEGRNPQDGASSGELVTVRRPGRTKSTRDASSGMLVIVRRPTRRQYPAGQTL